MSFRHFHTAILAGLFFLSGASGLIFELLWVRLLSPSMGAGPATTSIVIGLFMGGLALGSMAASRIRGRELAAYGLAEIGAACWGVATPMLLALLEPVFGVAFLLDESHPLAAGALRFAGAALFVLPPTVLMGLSFPLLGRYAAGSAALLYASNTAGAVLGCFAGGLVLLPSVGASGTRWVASLTDFAVGAIALALAARRSPSGGEDTRAGSEALDRTLLASVAAWGAATMIVEIACERTLALSLGSSVYSLTLVVMTFIAGLALGGGVFSRLRLHDARYGLAAMGLMAGLATAAVIPMLGGLPAWIVPVVTKVAPHSFLFFLAAQVFIVLALLLPPTFVMGAGMPLACRAVAGSAALGPLYAASTLGSIAGSLGAGLLLIPAAGLRGALVLGAAGFLAAAGLAAVRLRSRPTRMVCYGSLAAALTVLAGLPRWEVSVLTSGPFLYAGAYQKLSRESGRTVADLMTGLDKVLYHREGALATVTVRQSPEGHRSLAVNGKVDASTGLDMPTQLLAGHLPLVFAPEKARVLIVGLGSGVTAGAVVRHPIERVDCLELSPEVVEASRFFESVNGAPLADPRMKLRVADARMFVKQSRELYDVLCCEPSNPWVSGMAGLFTREHFTACRDRLERSGLICQWVQAYSLSVQDFRTIVRTFQSVFPEASLWEAVEGVDYLLLARKDGAPLTMESVAAAFGRSEVKRDLARAGLGAPIDLARKFVMGPAALARFAAGAPAHVDDLPRLEFTAPLALYRDTGSELIEAIEPLREGAEVVLATRDPEEAARIARACATRAQVRAARLAAGRGAVDEAEALLDNVLLTIPGDASAAGLLETIRIRRARVAKESGDLLDAVTRYERYLALAPADADAANELGVVLARLGRHDDAAARYRAALAAMPGHLAALRNLALASYAAGHHDEAIAAYEKLIVQDAKDALALNNLGICYMKTERWNDALDAWRRALRADPGLERARENIRIAEFLGYK